MPETRFPTVSLPLSSLWHIGETMRDVDPMLAWIAKRFTVERFLDIGAHVGEISLLARFHFGEKMAVAHAYEPHPELFEMCRYNMGIGGLDPGNIVRAAISRHVVPYDVDATIELRERGTSLLGSSTSMTDRVVRALTVPAVHPETLPRADVLSIDIEGAEADVIECYQHWDTADCVIVETHTRNAAKRARTILQKQVMELVQSVDHPRFPYRLELWSR